LQWVVEGQPRRDTLAFQVDLWSASGEFPRNMLEVMTREKEIRYSSRTRASTNQFKHVQRLRRAVAGLLDKLLDELKNSPEAQFLPCCRSQALQYRSSHLSREELRRPFEGLRIFACCNGGTLARRLPRCPTDFAAPRGAGATDQSRGRLYFRSCGRRARVTIVGADPTVHGNLSQLKPLGKRAAEVPQMSVLKRPFIQPLLR
jgi:hypothetical protein